MIALGRMVEVPADDSDLIHVSPIGLVPKSSGGYRMIHDLSCPEGASVNDTISRDDAATEYGSLEGAINKVAARANPANAYAFKVDLKDAFRNLRVHPDDIHLLGLTIDDRVYVDVCLAFGMRTSPAIFNEVARTALWIACRHPSLAPVTSDTEHFFDDFLGHVVGRHVAAAAMGHMLDTFRSLGLAINVAKFVLPTQTLTFLGIELRLASREAALPQAKLIAILALVNDFRQRIAASRHELLSLAGSLFHATVIAPQARTFMHHILRDAYSVPGKRDLVMVSEATRDDLGWWARMLPQWNGRAFFMFNREWVTPTSLSIQTDAAGNKGYALINRNRWSFGRWPPTLRDAPIHVTELVPIVFGALLWGAEWRGKAILFQCDNAAVVGAIINGLPRDPLLARLLRTLRIQSCIHDFGFTAVHVPGVNNTCSDEMPTELPALRQLFWL